MYDVQKGDRRAGREILIVRNKGRMVGCASLEFVNWMRDTVPSRQLRPEQRALVGWSDERPEIPSMLG